MSAGASILQAQVEAVLGELVRAATVELTKLFESRYQAAAAVGAEAGAVGRAEERAPETTSLRSSSPPGDAKRSVGVQVDGDEHPPPSTLPDTGCSRDWVEGGLEGGLEGPLNSSEVPLAGLKGHADPVWSPLKEHRPALTLDLVESQTFDAERGVVLQVCADPKKEPSWSGPSHEAQKPLVVRPDTSDAVSGEKVKFVCPLILKLESPDRIRASPKKPEPRQVHVKGSARGPSTGDAAAAASPSTPSTPKKWERGHTPMETKNQLQMKLRLPSQDPKLLLPCTVPLVDVVRASETKAEGRSEADRAQTVYKNRGLPLPKDFRFHQGPHTGHRVCCFKNGGDGVWRLEKVVAHTRRGYACGVCRKTFKRRKILRRHERFHTGEKPYACPRCSKTFALRKSLRRHTRFHTGERPHACSQCGKSFRLRDNLKAHSRFHTGEKPFSCAICSKTFRILRNLERHRLTQCDAFVPSFRTLAGL